MIRKSFRGNLLTAAVIAGLALHAFRGFAQQSDSAPPDVAHATQSPAPRLAGIISGTVVDRDGSLLPGARVALLMHGRVIARTTTDAGGAFRFTSVPAGAFTLKANATGFATVTFDGVTVPTETIVPALSFGKATTMITVNAISQHQASEIEVKQEESQRILGIIPNFGVSYNWNAPPMDSREKFRVATRLIFDPYTLGVTAISAGVEQATGTYHFGPGAPGYFKRFGAATADVAIGSELGGAILPSVLHQDPRYFWKGTGSVRSRVFYALAQAFVCRGDNGKQEVNYSDILGSYGAGAISNLYYPAADRNGVGLTIANGSIALGANAVGNVIEEFLLKRFTTHTKNIQPTAP